ncbi:MAG TPA: hypothetical protein VNM72_04910 [Blastocatellia bacterium]|nr:hypothetical protein [Blastocatellia bacterium]
MNDRIKKALSQMKGLEVSRSDPRQSSLYNFALGAVYSLARAEQLGYPWQSQEPGREWRRMEEAKGLVLRMLVEDQPPEQGEWLAAFYFNDAIVRLDLAFEHILRCVGNLGPTAAIGEVREVATRKSFPSELLTIWSERGRNADNMLKHRSLEILEDPGISFTEALSVMENLVCALAWVVRNPSSQKMP